MVNYKIKLGDFSYDIRYRPGTQNPGADGLSQLTHLSKRTQAKNKKGQGLGTTDKTKDTSVLEQLHRSMGHAGVIRLWHLVKQRNLAFELADVEKLCNSCLVCDKVKPKYFKNNPTHLIGATQPLQKLSLSLYRGTHC